MTQVLEEKLNVHAVRAEFPILKQVIDKKPLIYFDNAASSQTPKAVIDAIVRFYEKDHANIHRGVHTLAERATTAYEESRKETQLFINARENEEIIFTKGTTEGINLVAQSWGWLNLKENDEIIISHLEHHSNIVPWQLIAQRTGARLRIIPVNTKGELKMEEFKKLLNDKTKIVAVNYISNSLGTINPVKDIVQLANTQGVVTLIDAAQAAPHEKIDVQALNCDFLAFSGHKMYGPTGVGVLYGKRARLEEMLPYQGGGEMIKNVSIENTTYNDIPYKFEAGTPNIGDIIAFKEAITFINKWGYHKIQQHEQTLLQRVMVGTSSIDRLKPIGTADQKVSVFSFLVEDIHPYDLGQLLDAKGIAVRTGHHCTQPLMDFFKIEGTIRASFALYNTLEEIDYFCESLQQIIHKLRQ